MTRGVFIRKGAGSRVWSENGREFIDLLIGSGPMILGHGHPEVLEAVFEQLPLGMTFFANNSRAIELAEEICRAVACAEQVRFVSSRGEADMFAMRLARAHTGRDLILKFEGGYHGMSAEAQMSLAPIRPANYPDAIADSAGIPDSVRRDILVAPFNDIEFLQKLLDQRGDEIASVIVEPLQRIIPADIRFLRKLRSECDRHGILLTFNEIVTGFPALPTEGPRNITASFQTSVRSARSSGAVSRLRPSPDEGTSWPILTGNRSARKVF